MEYGDLIDVLAAYRRPGTPVFAYHYRGLPDEVCAAENVSALIAILEDGDLPPKVRGHAAGALGRIGDRRALPALLTAVDQARLRRQAALGLGLLGAPEATGVLEPWAPRLSVAQWALEQVRGDAPGADAPESGIHDLIEDLQRGQLRAIRGKIEGLPAARRAQLGLVLVEMLQGALDSHQLPEPWLLTALQHTAPPVAGPLLSRALAAALAPEGRFIWNRLLRAVGAVAPVEAIAPLADAICHTDMNPGGRQLAATCLDKLVTRRGPEATRATASHAPRLGRAAAQLEEVLASTPPVEAERPWHHYPGTAGWRAGCERAIAAIRRLLARIERAEPGPSSTS